LGGTGLGRLRSGLVLTGGSLLRLSLSQRKLRLWRLGKLRNSGQPRTGFLSKRSGGQRQKAEAGRERCREKTKT
jgi:hypothetical protein